MLSWVKAGGTLVVTPTSLIADEYSRRRDYLATLGLELTGEERPEFQAGEAKRGIDQSGELDFIQGPVAKTTVSKVPKRQVSVMRSGLLATMPATLDAAGVIQTIKPSADWSVLATYAGGTDPAILSRPMGEGRVVYLAAQLTVDSRRAVLDRLMEQCRVARPIRMHTPDGGYPSGVESRTVSCEGAFLTYLANTTDRSVAVTLAARAPIGEFWDYNRAERVSGPAMTLAPFETRIMRIRLRP